MTIDRFRRPGFVFRFVSGPARPNKSEKSETHTKTIEKYLIKDKNGSIVKKSENLNQLISKTSWNKLKLIK